MKNFVKHFKKLSIILWLIPSTAYAEFRHFNNWTTEEKALYTGYATVAYIDHRQTQSGLGNPCECYYEKNDALYGRYPHRDKSAAINFAILAGIYYAVGSRKEDSTNWFLFGLTAGRAAVVVQNDRIGIDWRVAF